MNCSYRRWRLDDAESVHQLLRDTWLDAYARLVPRDDLLGYLNEHHGAAALRAVVDDPEVVGFVAEVDGTLAGYERTRHDQEQRRLYVQQLYILPRYQGLGLGRRLMALAAERATALGLDRVWLGVMAGNASALAWYRKMGYTIAATEAFTMGKTAVEHYIGFVPVSGLIGPPGAAPRPVQNRR